MTKTEDCFITFTKRVLILKFAKRKTVKHFCNIQRKEIYLSGHLFINTLLFGMIIPMSQVLTPSFLFI